MATFKLAHNATVAKLIDAPESVCLEVSKMLSYTVDGADHLFSVTSGSWNGISTFFDTSNNTFPAGFVFMVTEKLKAAGHKVILARKPHVEPLGPENPIVDTFGNDDTRYDYQMKALRQVEKYGRGIIQVATGGGKSKIAKLIMSRYRRVTLFLTTRGILLYQMDDQLKEIGINTGQIGDGERRFVRGVNLGMVQTLQAAVKEPKLEDERLAVIKSLHLSKRKSGSVSNDEIMEIAKKRFEEKTKRRNAIIKMLELVEVVIGEEAHEAGGNSYYEILSHCKNATVRVALTATPFMRDSAEDNMRLMAAFGPKLIIITEKMLIERGILAKPFFKIVDSSPPPKLRRSSPWQRAYQLGYMENEFMLKDMLADALKAKRHKLPTMTLIQRTEHGETIREAYEAAGLSASFIRGANNQEERKREIAKLAKGEIDVLIGTNILDVGVDVPAVGLLQIAGGGKAEVAMRQRIGRSLRSKKHMPNFAFVADYTCNVNATLKEHALQRLNIIKRTPGFVEGILPAGRDFDWSIFAGKTT